VQYNSHGLTIYGLTLWSNVCVSFGSNGFMIKTQPFLIDGHYRKDIISGVGHPRSDSIMPLVLCMVAVEWLGHRHYITGSSEQCQPC
jgi:hypothetical protein